MTEREKPCSERVGPNLEREIAEATRCVRLLDLLDAGRFGKESGVYDDQLAEIIRSETIGHPLGIGKETIYKLEISWGGPGSYITFKLDGYQPYDGSYHFTDWFDHAETAIGDEELEKLLRAYDVPTDSLSEMEE